MAKCRTTTTFIIGSWSPFETGVVANVPGEGVGKEGGRGKCALSSYSGRVE